MKIDENMKASYLSASGVLVQNPGTGIFANILFECGLFSLEPQYVKLRASPQSVLRSSATAEGRLEWWNAGILEKWGLGYCNIG
jgi:hypothetical protein